MKLLKGNGQRNVFKVNSRILFMGDDDCDRAAAYLLCVLGQTNATVSYVPSQESVDPTNIVLEQYSLVIVSDYPRKNAPDAFWQKLTQWVDRGGKFLMLGGWESFHGKFGEYKHSPIEAILPVEISDGDDRYNPWQGVLIHPGERVYPALSTLDWSLPPVIAGYNRFEKKVEAIPLLYGYTLSIKNFDGKLQMVAGDPHCIACTMRVGEGVATAIAFDFAPHWIGGGVDWGRSRVSMELPEVTALAGDRVGVFPKPGSVSVETGNQYRDMVELLIRESMSD